MRTDFSLRFQWANNHSESVPCLCVFCQLKCQLALFGHFQMQRQMSALVGNMARKIFFLWEEVVGMHNHPFSLTQEYFSEMKFGALALMSSLS